MLWLWESGAPFEQRLNKYANNPWQSPQVATSISDDDGGNGNGTATVKNGTDVGIAGKIRNESANAVGGKTTGSAVIGFNETDDGGTISEPEPTTFAELRQQLSWLWDEGNAVGRVPVTGNVQTS